MLAHNIIKRDFKRHVIGRVIATLINVYFLDISIYDPQSGLKIFRTSDQLSRSVKVPFRTRWFFDVELVYRLSSLNSKFTIYEHSVGRWEDIRGGSLGINSAGHIMIELIQLFIIKKNHKIGKQWT
jgi:dolichyl-phosphate beta-glucosyltransferase